jgi:hypothetical protein
LKSNSRDMPGGDVEVSNWSVHYDAVAQANSRQNEINSRQNKVNNSWPETRGKICCRLRGGGLVSPVQFSIQLNILARNEHVRNLWQILVTIYKHKYGYYY